MACSQSLNTHNNDGLTTINLCESDLFAPTTAKELFDSIKCVALETTDECLIATVTKIIVDEERIYIYLMVMPTPCMLSTKRDVT